MRYLCPICRAPQQETIENICVTYWVTLCDGCYKQFMPGGTSDTPPPFPWKRRARGIRYRALCTARSLQPQRVEYVARRVRTGYYNPLDAVITRDGSDVEADSRRP